MAILKLSLIQTIKWLKSKGEKINIDEARIEREKEVKILKEVKEIVDTKVATYNLKKALGLSEEKLEEICKIVTSKNKTEDLTLEENKKLNDHLRIIKEIRGMLQNKEVRKRIEVKPEDLFNLKTDQLIELRKKIKETKEEILREEKERRKQEKTGSLDALEWF
jgi:xylose isomerase